MIKKLAFLFTLLISGTAFALPLGNPWEASLMREGVFCEGHGGCYDYCDPCMSWCDAWSIRIGFYGDYVFDTRMEITSTPGDPNIHESELYTNAGFIAVNFWDRFDIFATLGATQLEAIANARAFGASINTYVTLLTDTGFSWSIGGRATIFECGCFGFGLEAQYFRTNPNINFTKLENIAPLYHNGAEIRYHEWQVGLGAAYRINIASCATALVPYMGIKVSHAYSKTDTIASLLGGTTVIEAETDPYFGYAVGVTLLGCEKSTVTVEARFLNEKAVHVNGQIRF